MSDTFWKSVESTFDRALQLPEGERLSFVEGFQDEAVRAEVLSLLQAAEQTGFARLEDLVFRVAPNEPTIAECAESTALGPYRLICEIGRGGMSRVYLARRSDDAFDRKVAIKRILTQLDSESMRERFVSERQILADLEHPDICRLYDGGTDATGAPFLVMEYLEGVLPIDEHCEEYDLTIRQRLDLFCRVCEAVEYAHQNLVVHRDIKPANILVSSEGAPKLLDFGVAKLIPESGDDVTVTQIGTRALTPGYASPEQLQAKTITTASDIFSLGAVLYRLLTRTNALKSEFSGRLQDVIDGTDPAPASSQQAGYGVRLRGDLDAILAKALRGGAEQRYTTVRELRRDLENTLQGRPVVARKGTLRYRLGKFAKRQWLPLAASAALVAVGGVSLARSLEDASLLRQERDKLRAVSDYLVDMLKTSNPEGEVGGTESAQELVVAGAARVSAAFASEPPVEAELQRFIGRVFENLGMYPEASAAHRRNLELLADFAPGDRAETSQGLLYLSKAEGKAGNLTAALERSDEALNLAQGASAVHETEAYLVRGELLWESGKVHEALEVRQSALRLARELPDSNGLLKARAMRVLAINMMSMGEGDEAFKLSQEALGIRERVLGSNHPDLASDHVELGSIKAGVLLDHEGALLELERALQINRRYLPENHPEIIAIRSRTAQFLHETGQSGAAAEEAAQVIRLSKEHYGENHPKVATEWNNYGIFLMASGRLDEAERALRSALDARNRLYPDGQSAWVAQSNYGLGIVLIEQEQFSLAAEHLEKAMKVMQNFPRRVAAIPLPDYARCLSSLGRVSEAEPIAREGYERLAEAHPSGHRRVLIAQEALGSVLAKLGQNEEATLLLEESYAGLRERLGEENLYTARARQSLEELQSLDRIGGHLTQVP